MKTKSLHLSSPAAELFETVYPALQEFVRPTTGRRDEGLQAALLPVGLRRSVRA